MEVKEKKNYVQVPVKNVMAKEYLEVKAVAKPSFIQFFRQTTFFKKVKIRKSPKIEASLSISKPKEYSESKS